MPSGGVVTIKTRNVTFNANNRPKDLPAGDYAVLSVGDTGTGMSEEVRARAFEPFFTTKQPGKGSGLGLSMTFGVARQSGGGVRIDTQTGAGTSIEVYLPRADVEVSSKDVERGPSVQAPVACGQVVLVLDDDSDVREVTAAMLDSLGFSVIGADSGPAALEVLCSTNRVDLMLVDLGMRGMNGIETAREARAGWPDLPVLFSTGYTDLVRFGGGDIDRNRIVGKPYRREELLSKIDGCLRRQPRAPRA